MKKLVRIKKELNLYNIESIVCDLYGIAHSNNDASIRFSENEGEQLYFIHNLEEDIRYFLINIISIAKDESEFLIEEVELIEA